MIPEDALFSIFQKTLSLMLQMEPTLDARADLESFSHDITACVQITGEQQGAVVLQCSDALARKFAARLIGTEEWALSDEEIRDAFGELTNMIGGNVKCYAPDPSFLSIPTVTNGSNYNFHLVGSRVVQELSVRCESLPCRVIVWQCSNVPTANVTTANVTTDC